jgi:Glycosyltransferases involved in cell wall biogenesis
MMKVSTIILTYNSASVIEQTILSCLKISSEIFIVDSYSSDDTLEICKKYTDKIYQRAFKNYSDQRNWAMRELQISGDYELHLDADERLSERLAAEITLEVLDKRDPVFDGFLIPRMVYFMNKRIKHGGYYPIYHMRLFKRGKGRVESRRYDQHFVVRGKIKRLKGYLIDFHAMSLEEWTTRHNKWSSEEAIEIVSPTIGAIKGHMFGNAIERRRYLREVFNKMPPFIAPFLLFVYRYFLRLGFLDGREGLIYCFLQTLWYRFLIDAKIYEKLNIQGVSQHTKNN